MARTAPSSSLVSLRQLHFRFERGVALFEGLELSFDHTPTALVGRNGSGKSALLRLIAGELSGSSGAIERYGSCAYVSQHAAEDVGVSVAQVAQLDGVLESLQRVEQGRADADDFEHIGDRWDLAARFRTALDETGLGGFAASHPAHALSCGQRMRVALAGALLSGADLLLLDEPTNHLDADGRRWLLEQLGHWRGGLIVASHDRGLLRSVQRIVELTPHGARSYGGNYALFLAQREAERHAAQAALDAARHERERSATRLRREHDTIQRHASATRREARVANVSGSERFAMKAAVKEAMGRTRRDQREHKAALDAQVREAAARVLPDEAVLVSLTGQEDDRDRRRSPARLFALEGVRLPLLAHDDPAASLDWSLAGPVRVALSGPNGCGKSTLLRTLAGELAPQAGRCTMLAPFAYLDQRLAQLDPTRSIVAQLGLADTPLAEGALRSRLALLQLDADRATRPTGELSGGERLKAALALALWRDPPARLLLLDEPTNHLDLASTQAFEQALQGYAGALIVASHDADFLAALRPTHLMQWTPDGWRFETLPT